MSKLNEDIIIRYLENRCSEEDFVLINEWMKESDIMLGSFVVFRQIYLYIVAHYVSNEIIPIAMSYPAGWFVCSVATLIYYRFCKFDSHRLVEDV